MNDNVGVSLSLESGTSSLLLEEDKITYSAKLQTNCSHSLTNNDQLYQSFRLQSDKPLYALIYSLSLSSLYFTYRYDFAESLYKKRINKIHNVDDGYVENLRVIWDYLNQ